MDYKLIASLIGNVVLLGGFLITWGKMLKEISSMKNTFKLIQDKLDEYDTILHPDPDEGDKKLITLGECKDMQTECQLHVHNELVEIKKALTDTEKKRESAKEANDQRWVNINHTLGMIEQHLKQD
ncbi:hypothetical protein LCGC14_1352130 [marine sediment metagenome]|uniref:Uncharacterized protein n=1 Tax=marine sediment metagenome TaxID=412755 RepID=A0A0F9MR87_9ZZZZ